MSPSPRREGLDPSMSSGSPHSHNYQSYDYHSPHNSYPPYQPPTLLQQNSATTQHSPFAGPALDLAQVQSPSAAHPARHVKPGASSRLDPRLELGSPDGSNPTTPGSLAGRGIRAADSINPTRDSENAVRAGSSVERSKGDVKSPDAKAQPAWMDLKTKAGKERKRLPLACIACRRKKIRCSGEIPTCKHCIRSRIPCVYKASTRKAAPRTDYMAMLDKRLKRMEERVIKIMPKDERRNVDVIGRAVVKPAMPGPTTTKPGNKKRQADEAFSGELNQWSKSRQHVKGLHAEDKPREHDKDDLLVDGADHLPPLELQQHLAEVFFDFVYGQSYHLLHKPSYMRKLQAGQLPPVLVLAVCAISARFSTHAELRTEPAFLRGEQWAKPAREIALKRYETPQITILIVYLILGLHEFGTCQGGRSWMLGGMANRMAYALQLHKELDDQAHTNMELTSTDREIRRRTMWSCFMMDKFNSSGTERPIFVTEKYLQLQLPVKESYFQMGIAAPTENLAGTYMISAKTTEHDAGQVKESRDNIGCAAYLVKLVSLWGHVVRYFNLGGREEDKHPLWSTESGFTALRKSLDEYRRELPASMAWSLENLQIHSSENIANQFILVHIVYNQINLFMNRFALPIAGSPHLLPKDMPRAFLDQCARIALDAACQISILVNQGMNHRVVAPFAGYSAFLSSTVHIHGAATEASSRQYLTWNIKFLGRMKKYWGMFHFMTENLKTMYRQHNDAVTRAPQAANTMSGQKPADATIFQYGDWFDRYPHGVSENDYEEAAPESKKEPGADVFGQSDLQTVEDFFASRATTTRKVARKKRTKSTDHGSGDVTTHGRRQRQHPQPQEQQEREQMRAREMETQSSVQRQHGDGQVMSGNPAQRDYQSSSMTGTSDDHRRVAQHPDASHDMALLQSGQRPPPPPQIYNQLSTMYGPYDATRDQMDPNDQQGPMSFPPGMLDMPTHPSYFLDNSGDSGSGNGGNVVNKSNLMSSYPNWSSAWFMPFNVDPPLGEDSGFFDGGGGGGGGAYDFTGFAGPTTGMSGFEDMELVDDMGQVGGQQLSGLENEGIPGMSGR